jgi:hypothetical protein
MRPSQAPARAAPIAGASLEVSAEAMRGLRQRKGFALSVRREARRRVRKRWRRRWERRISESEAERRTFSDLWKGTFGLGLV